MEEVKLPSGQVIRMHSKSECSGHCPIHNPSEHHMRSWKLIWRDDRKIFERICDHGVGHPDPDTLAFFKNHRGNKEARLEAVHGCDGCCNPPRLPDWRPSDPGLRE